MDSLLQEAYDIHHCVIDVLSKWVFYSEDQSKTCLGFCPAGKGDDFKAVKAAIWTY